MGRFPFRWSCLSVIIDFFLIVQFILVNFCEYTIFPDVIYFNQFQLRTNPTQASMLNLRDLSAAQKIVPLENPLGDPIPPSTIQMNNSASIPPAVQQEPTHIEYHINSGQYLKSAVYGGTDGVINCLAVIIGGIASGSTPAQVVGFAMSVVIGDGVGMGLGDYLSAKAEKQFIVAQEQRELWEIDHELEEEKHEAAEIFKQKGYNEDQSKRLSQLFATNKQAFANLMMLYQLGLVVDDTNPIINGFVNSLSYVVHGILPLIPYFISYSGAKDNSTHHLWVIAIGGVELFILGFSKAMLIGMPLWRRFVSALESVALGAVAISIGYGIGKIFENM